MVSIFSKITGTLVANGNISKEDEAVYQYALKSILILGVNILLSLLIGIYMGMPVYCMLFLCALIPLRSDAGGYHAPNMIVCYLLSFASLILTLLWVKEGHPYQTVTMAVAACLSCIYVFVFSPLESKNKPLREHEKKCIQKRARIIVSAELVIGFILLIVNQRAAYTIWSAIIWCAIGHVAWFVERKVRVRSLIVVLLAGISFYMPVRAQEQPDEGKAVVFLLDVSGSMKTNDPERLAVDSIAQLIYTLPSDYRVGFVAYSTEVVTQQDLVGSSHRSEIMNAAENVAYKGYSNAGAGLLCAVDTLEDETAGEKCIVMLSDGEILMAEDVETESSVSSYQAAIEQAKEQGITIHVIGLGEDMEDADISIFDAASETGGNSYHSTQATELQKAIDSILNEELGIKQSTVAIVDADGGLEEVAVELPYIYADKLRVLLTGSAPIQNLNTNFQAESAKQINGARYSLLEIERPSGNRLELSFEGTEGSQVRVNVIPEYHVLPKAEIIYEDKLPKADELTENLYYDRTAKIAYTFYNEEKQSVQLWNSEYFEHNKISVSINGEAKELILNAGKLDMTENVKDSCEYEVKFDYSGLPVNVIGTSGVKIRLEAPPLVPVEEPEEPKLPYLLIGTVIAGFLLLVIMVVAVIMYLNRPKPAPAPVEERPEPGKYHYVGKINIYITRTRSGYDIPPLTYNLFRLPTGKVISLQEILEECEVQEDFQGAADIYLKAGANRNLILTNNSDCTIIKNREILMKNKSYQISMDSKVDVSFEDEISELTFQYKDLKPSEMR